MGSLVWPRTGFEVSRPRAGGFVLAGGFFIFALILGLPSPQRFVIPDELAMHVVAERVRQSLPIKISSPLSSPAQDLVHPRSMTVIRGAIVPEGFFFIAALYGTIQRVANTSALPWLLVAASTLLAAFAFKKILKFVDAPEFAARVAPVVYPIIPPILYYTLHPYLANLLQLNLVIVSIALLIFCQSRSRGHAGIIVAGVVLGIALALRPVEAVWIVPLVLVVVMVLKKTPWSMLLLTVVGSLLPLAWSGVLQHSVFGSWFGVGYASNPMLLPNDAGGPWALVHAALFPFGIHPGSVVRRFGQLMQLFWWWVPCAGVGLPSWLSTKRRRAYVAVSTAVSLFLFVYYGSWQYSEPEDTGTMALSVGFVRYLLPMWALWTPIVVSGIGALATVVHARLRPILWAGVVSGFVISPMVILPGNIQDQLQETRTYRARQEAVLALTSPDAILVVKRSDKVFFPMRSVVVWYTQPQRVAEELVDLIDSAPVYLDVVDQEGASMLLPSTVEIEKKILVSNSEQLWKLTRASHRGQ